MNLKRAHSDMLRRLAAIQPTRIVGIADAPDVLTATEHLAEVNAIVMAYLDAVLDDTIAHLPAGTPDTPAVVNAIWDAVNEDPDYDPVAWLARAGCPLGLRAAA